MFSGGTDSTAALYKLLKADEEMVVAHHINFINIEQRHGVEQQACREIIDYLRTNVRYVEYTESTFAFPYNAHIGWDIINAMYIGGLVCKNYASDTVQVELSIADTKDDFGSYQWKTPVAQVAALVSALEQPTKKKQHLPIITQPVVEFTKLELIEDMPKELFDLTWACRKPNVTIEDTQIQFEYCGKCTTCQTLKTLGRYEKKTRTISK